MKKYLLPGLFLLSLNAVGQTQVILREDFTDNNLSWYVVSEANYSSSVSDGHFKLVLKKDGWTWWNYHSCMINPAQPFIVRSEFKFTGGAGNGIFGVTWNTEDDLNNFTFALSRSGKFALFAMEKGKKVVWNNWAPSKILPKLDTYYTFTLKSDTKKYFFYLGDALIAEIPFKNFNASNYLGFYVENFVNVKVNYLEVLQDRGKLLVVEGGEFTEIKKENLGSLINTRYTEKKPVISHDGKTLYFTREGDPANIGDPETDDIWFAELGDQQLWGAAKNLGHPIDNKSNNSLIGVAADNSWLMVKGAYTAAGEYEGEGFSISRRSGNSWTNPQKIGMTNYYNKNKYSESCINPGGDVMLLAVERDQTFGGKDLYVSKKGADGTWTEPVNCGSVLNSFADEIGPFIAGDDKTVYFASEGHPGYGDADIFMSKRLDDTWTNWSTPVNLGPKINSSSWDAYFSTDAKGEWGYMVSTLNAIGSSDIFRFKLPEKAKPEVICVLKGTIINAKTNEPMIAEITFKLIENDSLLGNIYANPSDGKFSTVFKEGLHLSLEATYPGYIGERISVNLVDIPESNEKEVVLYLKPIEVKQTFELNNVFFAENDVELHYHSKSQLHAVANMMKANPKMTILIGGHTMKNDADEKYNVKLSEQRAKAVYNFLIELGVSKKRMKYKGFGSSKPVYEGLNPAENAKNRCVSFTIITM